MLSLALNGLASSVGEHGHGVLVSLDGSLESLKDSVGGVFRVQLLHLILLALICSLQQLLRQSGILGEEGGIVAPVAVQELELRLLLQDGLHVTLLNGTLQSQDLGSVPDDACNGLALCISQGCLGSHGGNGHTGCLQRLSPIQVAL